jgi:hypothetical protein
VRAVAFERELALERVDDRRLPTALLRTHPRLRRAPHRTAEGKTKTEIIRCLKRYIARELYHALVTDLLGGPPGRPRPAAIVSITCGAGTTGRTIMTT